MKKDKKNRPRHLDAPVIRTEQDLQAHDLHSPACVPVTAALVKPVWTLVNLLHKQSPRGELARALELLLVGLDEDDPVVLESGVKAIVKALFLMGVLTNDT